MLLFRNYNRPTVAKGPETEPEVGERVMGRKMEQG